MLERVSLYTYYHRIISDYFAFSLVSGCGWMFMCQNKLKAIYTYIIETICGWKIKLRKCKNEIGLIDCWCKQTKPKRSVLNIEIKRNQLDAKNAQNCA